MLIYIMFSILFALLIFSYFYFKRDIVNPAVLFFTVYSFSVFCALFNIEKWGIEIQPITFCIIIGGALEFLMISIICKVIFEKKQKDITEDSDISNKENNDAKLIEINKKREKNINIFLAIIIIYSLIVLIVLSYHIISISAKFGKFSNISEMLTLYKEATSYTTHARLPKYVTILMKPFIAGTYICYYIFIKKILDKNIQNKNEILKLLAKNLPYLIPTILYIISVFIQSNREAIIIIIFNYFIMTVIFWYKKNEWNKTIKPVFLLETLIIGVFGLILFFFSAKWVGRINEQGMFDYITFYCGGSIECLNQYMKEPKEIEVVRGEETFYNLINTLDSFKITNYNIKDKLTVHKEFRYYNGKMIGNVYTGYRRWIHDYGIPGMIILQFVFALVINIIYYSIKYTKSKNRLNDFLIIFYSYLSYTIYLQPIDDYFYFDVIGQASLAVIICIIIEYIITYKIYNKFNINAKEEKNE